MLVSSHKLPFSLGVVVFSLVQLRSQCSSVPQGIAEQWLQRLKAGQGCLSDIPFPGAPSPSETAVDTTNAGTTDTTNVGTTNESTVETIRIAIRPWPSHRFLSFVLQIWLEEFFRYRVMMVELDTNGSDLLSDFAHVDVDIEVWSFPNPSFPEYSAYATELVDLGPLGNYGQPGIYPSPRLERALLALYPQVPPSTEQHRWFTYYRSLASPQLLDLLPPANDSYCREQRCFFPTQCTAASSTQCRMLFHEDPIPLGGLHTETMLEVHRLPFVIVYLSRSAWTQLMASWETAPRLVVCSSQPPSTSSSSTATQRFQFPYVEQQPSGWPAPQDANDWQLVPLRKVVSKDLQMRVPHVVISFFNYVNIRRMRIAHTHDWTQFPPYPLGDGLDDVLRVSACHVARTSLTTYISECFDSQGNAIQNPDCQSPVICLAAGVYTLHHSPTSQECRPCPVGSFCPAGMDTPMACLPGTTTPLEGASTVDQCVCAPGFEGAQTLVKAQPFACTPCLPGMLKKTLGNGKCTDRCPQHSTTREGAVSVVQCECLAGFFLHSVVPWHCEPCPVGATCPGGVRNSTRLVEADLFDISSAWQRHLHQGPIADPQHYGYFLEVPDNLEIAFKPRFGRCPVPEACLGNNMCAPGTAGPSCDLCEQGYVRNLREGRCQACAESSDTFRWRVFRQLVEPFLYWWIVRIVAIGNADTAVLTPIILKIGSGFLQGINVALSTMHITNRSAAENNGVRLYLRFVKEWTHYDGGNQIWHHVWMCTGRSGLDDPDAWAASARQAFIFTIFEELIRPLYWPSLAITSIVLCTMCCYQPDRHHYIRKMRFLERLGLLCDEEEEPLHYADVAIEDYKAHLCRKHTVAGVWRPIPIMWQTSMPSSRRQTPKGRVSARQARCCRRLQRWSESFFWNTVSTSMPYWFFTSLTIARISFSCIMGCFKVETEQLEWRHVMEPSVVCFESGYLPVLLMGVLGLIVYGIGFPAMICFVVRRKLQHREDWCFSWFCNGYSFCGRLSIYWDLVIWLRAALLGMLSSLPVEAWYSEQQIAFLIINSGFLLLQIFLRPFDGRRNNVLNHLEENSLAICALTSPLLAASLEYDTANKREMSILALLVFFGLAGWFCVSVARQFTREVRDAVIQVQKEERYKVWMRGKRQLRKEVLEANQQRWVAEMLLTGNGDGLAAPLRLQVSQTVKQNSASTSKLQFLQAIQNSLGWDVDPVRDMERQSFNDMTDTVSEFSDLKEEDEVPKGRLLLLMDGIQNCARRGMHFVEARALRGHCWRCLFALWRVVGALCLRLEIWNQQLEEQQNGYGLVLHSDQCKFQFQGCSRQNLVSSLARLHMNFRQRQEVVNSFTALFYCLFSQHQVTCIPFEFSEMFLSEAAVLASSDRRSLKWRNLQKKARAMVDDLSKSGGEELPVGLSALDDKMGRCLDTSTVSGQLVKLHSLENYVLRTQTTQRAMLNREMSLATACNPVERKVDASTDMTSVDGGKPETPAARGESEYYGDRRIATSALIRSLSSLGGAIHLDCEEDMILFEDRTGDPISSHLDDFLFTAGQCDTEAFKLQLRGRSFNASLSFRPSPESCWGQEEQDTASCDPSASCAPSSLSVDSRPQRSVPQTRLMREVETFKTTDDGLRELEACAETSAWPTTFSQALMDLIINVSFLDNRCKYALIRMSESCALELIECIAQHHAELRHHREDWAKKLAAVVADVEQCRASVRGKRGAEPILQNVLCRAEGVVAAIGLEDGSHLFFELGERLRSQGFVHVGPEWRRSHGQWLRSAIRARMHMVTTKRTRSGGVPYLTLEEETMIHRLDKYLGTLRSGEGEHALLQTALWDVQPPIQQFRVWPAWQALQRHEESLCGALGHAPGLHSHACGSTSETLAEIAAKSMLEKEDWAAMHTQLSGKHGEAFDKQLWMVMEEWRQSMLDWAYSNSTHKVQHWSVHSTRLGAAYEYQIEEYKLGRPSHHEHHLNLDGGGEVDLEACLKDLTADDTGLDVQWCPRGAHEFTPVARLGDDEQAEDPVCVLCESLPSRPTGSPRSSAMFQCIYCEVYLCEDCQRVATFVMAEGGVGSLGGLPSSSPTTPKASPKREEECQILEELEANAPMTLLEELGKLEGRLNCMTTLGGQEIAYRQILRWAQRKVLSPRSFLCVLLCPQGKHIVGKQLHDVSFRIPAVCSMCHLPQKQHQCVVCSECFMVFCHTCAGRAHQLDRMRDELASLLSRSVIDGNTFFSLSRKLSSSPVVAVELMGRLRTSRASERQLRQRNKIVALTAERTAEEAWCYRGSVIAPLKDKCVETESHSTGLSQSVEAQASLARDVVSRRRPEVQQAQGDSVLVDRSVANDQVVQGLSEVRRAIAKRQQDLLCSIDPAASSGRH